MNRVIKFRAWDVFTKNWMDDPDYKICNCGNIALRTSGTNEYVCSKTDMFILMQFTGLLDKNGKEIYEGDIISDRQSEPRAVVFWEGAFCEMTSPKTAHIFNPKFEEVIGNIYENPNLLTP